MQCTVQLCCALQSRVVPSYASVCYIQAHTHTLSPFFACFVTLMHTLLAGSLAPLPKFTSQKVRQLLDQPDVKPYADLASAYSSKNSDRLGRVAEQHAAAFNAVS